MSPGAPSARAAYFLVRSPCWRWCIGANGHFHSHEPSILLYGLWPMVAVDARLLRGLGFRFADASLRLGGLRTILAHCRFCGDMVRLYRLSFLWRVLRRRPARAAWDALLLWAISWSVSIVIFGGGPLWSEHGGYLADDHGAQSLGMPGCGGAGSRDAFGHSSQESNHYVGWLSRFGRRLPCSQLSAKLGGGGAI